MKKVFKILGILLLVLVVLVLSAITWITQALPDIPVTDMKVEVTPERVARGEYLANHVTVCMDCHSVRDWSRFSAPPTPGTAGAGGDRFDQTVGFPGVFYARNITPFGLKDWTDGEIHRTITCGVGRDGEPFFPVMPYLYYGRMADEDIKSIIAYLRSLPPIESTPGTSKADFPFSVIAHTIPTVQKKLEGVNYGEYLVNAAGCMECHTKRDKGKPVGEFYAGGWEFQLPNAGTVVSSNITPHETGIGGWSKERFIRTFKQYADSGYVAPKLDYAAKEMQTVMPWTMYAGMTEDDLGAIYDHLRTVKPVENAIVKWMPL